MVDSMAITSWMFSTTHIIAEFLEGDEHMLHMSQSDMLWHFLQYLTLCLKSLNALQKLSVKASSRLSICNVNLSAVLRPIPGSLENSSMALSNSAEEWCCSIICLAVIVSLNVCVSLSRNVCPLTS